ncbi:glycosyltransferase family 4 protein [Flavisolibacter ginsengisoli]|jgi:glycosyltransferase involved in cell wall biosynthesis|uniref:Glycosyltransferase involved in cell wall bisynthesis n=1 Tax=Flavisolibacter ginsengisoli DSM 18119 TaxID=1121884 RepID=A0A1M5BAR2_9BACT|nr:glycosyltransferase [Flavisolibacter ginsengisoli]SHF39272.1 Glycosyltransferase involved in cell wall bisynthesis [Flavisolibacter ginsengisoli DSM 18119]
MARFLFYDDKIINLLLQEEKPSGGAAVQAYGWIKGLSEAGQDIYVMTNIKHNGPLKEECNDINLVPLYDQQKGIRWLRWIYYRFPYIYKKIKHTHPDYLYQGIPGWTSFLLGLICRQLNIKYILRISNDYLLDNRFYRNYSIMHRFFQRMGINSTYCILCQNDYQLSIIKKEFPGKVAIKIPNPIFLKNDFNSSDDSARKYIAWLGLYQYQKNIQQLYEIAYLLKEEQFQIAGQELGNCDKETQYYLDKLKQLPNVKFIGFLHRDQVLPFLSKAKFLLNTSHYEGFSNTFLEAMSVRTPILSSQNVNPDSIITKYNLGIVYKDALDLQKKYFHLTSEAYKAMSCNAFDYVAQQHDYRILSERLINFFSKN